MKKAISTLTILLLCLYMNAQVGSLDPAFNNASTPGYVINSINAGGDYGQAIATHSDGRIVVAVYAPDERITLVRYLSTGIIDLSFGTGGVVSLRRNSGDNAVPFAITVLSDNKILVAGFNYPSTKNFVLLKLLEDGTPDLAFGSLGWAEADFATGGNSEAHSIAVQSNGKIVLAGKVETAAGTNIFDFGVARFNSDGSIDAAGFGTGGMKTIDISGNDQATGVAIQSDGKIVVGGTSSMETANANFSVVRLLSDGTPDVAGYGTGGIATADVPLNGAGSYDVAYALALQGDGKVVMTGQSKPSGGGGNGNMSTIRFTTAGILDVLFNGTGYAVVNYGPGNTDEGARAIAVQSDGKIIVGGDTDALNGPPTPFALLLVRYNPDGTLDINFDGDGMATADITTLSEFGYALKLYSNRIYLAGSSGTTRDLLLAAIQNDGTPLPLVLSQFYAQKQTSKVVLQWQTTSEEDLKQFVIERSNDGKTYKAIGAVAAAGNSNTKKNYSFADQSPFMSTNNYYRLLMQDIDGNYKYSKILIIKFDGQLSTSMQVFPNPVKDLLQVQLPNGLNGTVGLQIIDMQGRVVKRNNLASDGNALNTTMDVSSLTSGVYILKAQAGNTTVISRFTKK